MQLRTLARDCLYLNWALPRETAPTLPAPLRYEVHAEDGQQWVFASALLFRVSGLHHPAVRYPRFSYPQMNLRLYVSDGDGVPSVLFLRMLVPLWMVPLSRLLARQPASGASFSYPAPTAHPDEDAWSWSLETRASGSVYAAARLEVEACLAAPEAARSPHVGSWERTVDYFRHRRRGYALWEDRLRPISTSHPTVGVWPLQVEVKDASLVADCLGEVDAEVWRRPHSAWLCPEIPFNFELGKLVHLPLPASGVPAAEGV
jgi:hypothetical protein